MGSGRLIFVSWVALGGAVAFARPAFAEERRGDGTAAVWTLRERRLAPEEPVEDTAAAESRAARSFARRHYLGLQLGGSAAFQLAYRLRAVERLHFDVGTFTVSGGFNGSAGLLYDFPMSTRTAPYVSAGGGFLGAAGEREACDADPQCVDSTVNLYVYFRAGVSVRVGTERRDVLGFDAGLWRGTMTDRGPSGVVHEEAFLWPMAGFSYHYAL